MDQTQKELYEQSWSTHSLRNPEMWPINTIIRKILKENGRILEIGPGNWPKSPISKTIFLELTATGAANLKKVGANTSTGSIENIPFKDETFDVVVALEVIEHVPNVQQSFSDVKRVLKKKGYFIFSTPIHQELWTHFDSLAGHLRRFDPYELLKITFKNEFQLIKFTGRKDPPILLCNINAIMETRYKKLLMFLSEIGLTILSSLHRSKIYRRLNRHAYDLNLWFDPDLYISKSKTLSNLTLICQRK
ncbi:MAG: methyltransferase domain-containing protein [Candidatus Heimdallarchaeota archaeon]|nr:MAG: methyltransferase domain-containing protein [Candidatus Heimdallarchaeota archaeon]